MKISKPSFFEGNLIKIKHELKTTQKANDYKVT